MLEKPDLQDERIFACLQAEYGRQAAAITFLPLGADVNTAVYRVTSGAGVAYFLKLRSGVFDEIAVTLPKFLSDQGVAHVIAPLATLTGQLWAELDTFKVILYPFIEGHNGYEVDLLDQHWVEFGAALKRIHSVALPPALLSRIQRETFSPQWRERVKAFLAHLEAAACVDLIAEKAVALLQSNYATILDLVARTEQFAQVLCTRSPEGVLCHSDLHAGNILIAANGAFYLVDWDNPIFAPKERDLMYAGGGQFGSLRTPDEEERLFYQGYGETAIEPDALAYYRYERIIEDIAVFCEQLLLTDAGGADREQALRYLTSNFEPNGIIEIAREAHQR